MENSLKAHKQIDTANEKLWLRRFDNLETAEKDFLSALFKAETAGYARGTAYASLNLAFLCFLNSKTDLALDYLNRSMTWLRENHTEKGYVRAILLEGNISDSYGDYEKTLSLWLEALKIARKIKARESEGESCSQLGLVYFRLSEYRKAIEYLESGLMIREELGDENGVASSLNRIGMVLRQTKRYEEALEYYFRSLEIRKKNRQHSAIPWTMLGIANTYEDSGDTENALEYYSRGMVSSDGRCRLQCMLGAGRIYSETGRYEVAEELLSSSLKTAQELKTQNLIADAYSALSQHYENKGNDSLALKYFKLFQKTRENYLSEEAQSSLRNIEVAHAIEKSEQEKEIFRLKNIELKKAFDIIEEKNNDITASISYARRIQNAILPRISEIKGLSRHIFILYLPKDIISGDFYWFSEAGGKIIIVAGDCTGHGVPGALMSMLGISFLEEIVNKQRITSPGIILDELSREIRTALRQKGDFSDTKDGMDMSICLIDKSSRTIRYSGANNNLFVISGGELTEYKADRMAAGYNEASDRIFSETEIPVKTGDMLYMFSDGFADQFGGPGNKKYKNSRLRETLLGIHALPPGKQKIYLEKEFQNWKGEYTQVDDVLLMGYKV